MAIRLALNTERTAAAQEELNLSFEELQRIIEQEDYKVLRVNAITDSRLLRPRDKGRVLIREVPNGGAMSDEDLGKIAAWHQAELDLGEQLGLYIPTHYAAAQDREGQDGPLAGRNAVHLTVVRDLAVTAFDKLVDPGDRASHKRRCELGRMQLAYYDHKRPPMTPVIADIGSSRQYGLLHEFNEIDLEDYRVMIQHGIVPPAASDWDEPGRPTGPIALLDLDRHPTFNIAHELQVAGEELAGLRTPSATALAQDFTVAQQRHAASGAGIQPR